MEAYQVGRLRSAATGNVSSIERRFELADHVKVTGANVADGLMTIELVREVPEELKPCRIEVQAWHGRGAVEGPRRVEQQAA